MTFKRTKATPAPLIAKPLKFKGPQSITAAASKGSVNQQRGREAEENVRKKFEAKGYYTDRTQFQTPFGEVDLFLRHPEGYFVACEVKYLQNEKFLSHRVGSAQVRRLRRCWLWLVERWPGTRFYVCFHLPNGRLLVRSLETFFPFKFG